MNIGKINLNFSFYSFYLLEIYNTRKKKITIEIDITGIFYKRGPGIFLKGINDILPYNTNNCHFISSQTIYPSIIKKKSKYYFIPYPQFNELIYNKWIKVRKSNKLILGPNFVPSSWKHFPNNKIWKEKRFSEIIKQVKGIAVHSERVKNYLAKKTKTINFYKKFKIIRPCTNIKPKNIQILNLFKNSSKIVERLKYGNYTKEKMEYLANNTKFIIYFSFFDTGAIGLKEIQNYGVFTFCHQSDLIIHKNTGFYVPELANEKDMIKAYKIIMKKIEIITNLQPDTKYIAKINQEINKCQNALNDLCLSLI